MCCFDVKNAEKMSHITRNKNVLCVCSAHQHWSNKYVPMVKLDKSQTKYYTHSSTHTLDTRHKYTRCMLAGPTQYSSRHSCIPSAVFVLNWIGHNELQKKIHTHTHHFDIFRVLWIYVNAPKVCLLMVSMGHFKVIHLSHSSTRLFLFIFVGIYIHFCIAIASCPISSTLHNHTFTRCHTHVLNNFFFHILNRI